MSVKQLKPKINTKIIKKKSKAKCADNYKSCTNFFQPNTIIYMERRKMHII